MFEVNGIVYAGEPTQDMTVLSAKDVGNHCLLVTFSTGETRLFDGTVLFDAPVFQPLSDSRVFVDFSIDDGVLTWNDGDIDVAPEYVYEKSYQYAMRS